MNRYQELLKSNGFVLISDKGIESSGFDFNYDHEFFDGCRMSQLAPLLFAQTKLHDLIQSHLIDSPSSGGNECHSPLFPPLYPDEDTEAFQMGECLAEMLCRQIPYELGSKAHSEFINGLFSKLQMHFK